MSYAAIAQLWQDPDIRLRLIACAATEGHTTDAVAWVDQHLLAFAAQPGWGDAYTYALDVGTIQRPGWDAGVINDQMILSAVQALS